MEDEKIAVVTGASKGIGRGISLALADAGYRIAVNYNSDREGAEETKRLVSRRGGECCTIQADVGIKAEVDRMFASLLDSLGTPDLLVNNAGVQTWKSLLELEEEDWDRTIRTNLKGTFLCTQRAAREMKGKKKGRIVNIGSGCNKEPFPNLVDYTCSKGGIEMLTRVSAIELGPLGITVNCVAPGAIEIERTRHESSDYAGTWGKVTPARRVGQVEDVAAAVVFLASPQAEFITGQTVYVDGGLFTQPPWPYRDD